MHVGKAFAQRFQCKGSSSNSSAFKVAAVTPQQLSVCHVKGNCSSSSNSSA
jgi:hypothetical protein